MDKFIKELIEEFNRCEEDANIPFLISVLEQDFNKNNEKFKDFLNDLKEYPDYTIVIEKAQNKYYGLYDVYISLEKHKEDSKTNYWYDYDFSNISYLIEFSIDKRYYGYCECTPDMKDYRVDKKCCGHGCDWVAPKFTLKKVIEIEEASFDGDEHDYWEYEDEYYNKNKDKKEKEIEKEIKRLEKIIEDSNKRLNELRGE